MGLLCWKNCQERRADRQKLRQSNRTLRTEARANARIQQAQAGFDSTATGAITGVAGSASSALSNIYGQFGQILGGGNSSSTITTGTNQLSGFVPVIVAIGAVLFAVLSFGGLFSKKRR